LTIELIPSSREAESLRSRPKINLFSASELWTYTLAHTVSISPKDTLLT